MESQTSTSTRDGPLHEFEAGLLQFARFVYSIGAGMTMTFVVENLSATTLRGSTVLIPLLMLFFLLSDWIRSSYWISQTRGYSGFLYVDFFLHIVSVLALGAAFYWLLKDQSSFAVSGFATWFFLIFLWDLTRLRRHDLDGFLAKSEGGVRAITEGVLIGRMYWMLFFPAVCGIGYLFFHANKLLPDLLLSILYFCLALETVMEVGLLLFIHHETRPA